MSFLHKPIPIRIKHLDKLKPLLTTLPSLGELKLTQTLDTVVTCRVCYGKGIIAHRNRKNSDLPDHYSYCYHCNGSREMSNHVI